jgi:hypothetical protein
LASSTDAECNFKQLIHTLAGWTSSTTVAGVLTKLLFNIGRITGYANDFKAAMTTDDFAKMGSIVGDGAGWLFKFNVKESDNGITDCIKTVVGLLPDIGYCAHDLENLDLDHATDMYNHI